VNQSVADAVNTSAETLPWLLVIRLPVGGAEDGGGSAGGGWLDFVIAVAKRQAV